MLSALERLGGMIIHPRRTLRAVLDEGQGSVFELIPWMIVASICAAPTQAGQAGLVLRVDLLGGVSSFLGLVANRLAPALIGLMVAAVVLRGLAVIQRTKPEWTFDRSLDACAYTLVPYLLLMVIGAGLSSLGLELWFMPHRLPRGAPLYLAARIGVSFSWSLLLYVLILVDLFQREEATTDE